MKTDYIGYLKYVLEHKKNVFKTCWRRGLYIHAFTHDLSKLLPSEFIPYAEWFNGEFGTRWKGGVCSSWELENYNRCHDDFKKAWKHHYRHNKHHWNYWIGKDIPGKYITQMICDWEAMGIKFGDTAQEYYLNNYNEINISDQSRLELENQLGLNDSMFHNYGNTLKQFKEKYNERRFNDYFGWIKDEYGIDVYNKI